jgi:hypothetical protein
MTKRTKKQMREIRDASYKVVDIPLCMNCEHFSGNGWNSCYLVSGNNSRTRFEWKTVSPLGVCDMWKEGAK